jgi:hypothetical protein
MFRLAKYLKPLDWVLVAITMCLLVIQVYLDLFLPDRVANIIHLFDNGKPSSAIKI